EAGLVERAGGWGCLRDVSAFDVDGPGLPVPRLVPELLVILQTAERRKACVPRPFADPPSVEVGGLWSHGGHGVHRRGAAHNLAVRNQDPPVALARVPPVELRHRDA